MSIRSPKVLLGPNDKGLTASMVNNYVKHGHVAKPIKKKYNAAQVARLIVITSLKTVFEISEIAKTLEILRTDAESQKSYYNDFVACMNGQFPQEAPQVILSACQTLQCYRTTHQLLNDLEGRKQCLILLLLILLPTSNSVKNLALVRKWLTA